MSARKLSASRPPSVSGCRSPPDRTETRGMLPEILPDGPPNIMSARTSGRLTGQVPSEAPARMSGRLHRFSNSLFLCPFPIVLHPLPLPPGFLPHKRLFPQFAESLRHRIGKGTGGSRLLRKVLLRPVILRHMPAEAKHLKQSVKCLPAVWEEAPPEHGYRRTAPPSHRHPALLRTIPSARKSFPAPSPMCISCCSIFRYRERKNRGGKESSAAILSTRRGGYRYNPAI